MLIGCTFRKSFSLHSNWSCGYLPYRLIISSRNHRVNFYVHDRILKFYLCTDAQKEFIDGTYVKTHNKLLLTNGRALGMRSDYNGILLFDTILQPTVEKSYDIVEIELPVFEVISWILITCRMCFTFVHCIDCFVAGIIDSSSSEASWITCRRKCCRSYE